MMITTEENHLRIIGGGLLGFVLYGLFFWRQLSNNPRNRLIKYGSITVIVFLAIIPISLAGSRPGWLFGAWLTLTVLLCFATLFFLLQRMIRAWARRSTDR